MSLLTLPANQIADDYGARREAGNSWELRDLRQKSPNREVMLEVMRRWARCAGSETALIIMVYRARRPPSEHRRINHFQPRCSPLLTAC